MKYVALIILAAGLGSTYETVKTKLTDVVVADRQAKSVTVEQARTDAKIDAMVSDTVIKVVLAKITAEENAAQYEKLASQLAVTVKALYPKAQILVDSDRAIIHVMLVPYADTDTDVIKEGGVK
jgi:hypothetical protein